MQVLQRQTQSLSYWAETFKVNEADIEHLYNVLLEREEPLSADEMALVIVRRRVREESRQIEEQLESATLYSPDQSYEVGQSLLFPSLHFASGTVVEKRPGENPEYGSFEVIQVQFQEGEPNHEFASQLQTEHSLIKQHSAENGDQDLLSAEELFIEYGGEVVDEIERYLAEFDDIVRIAGLWFPKSLLADVNVGHLNLAEAVLDMAGGGPLDAIAILDQIAILDNVNPRLQEFSLNFAMQEDPRFDEVGPAGQILWYLRHLEPPEVQTTPRHLVYAGIEYDPDNLNSELLALENELQDEHSPLRSERTKADSVTITLSYPHLRAGTLPLSARLKPFFPTAYEAPVIRFVLLDEHSGDEMPGWVARNEGYVFGLDEWYARYDIPVGGYLHIARTDDPGRVSIGYAKRKPRSEWIRLASANGNRIKFEMRQRQIGCDYDDMMGFAVDDLEAMDELWDANAAGGKTMNFLVTQLFEELAEMAMQNAVHAKTLYSAVNLIRRSPPGPIFEQLITNDGYKHVGGAYWRRDDGE